MRNRASAASRKRRDKTTRVRLRRAAAAVGLLALLATSPGLPAAAQPSPSQASFDYAFPHATFAQQDVRLERVTAGTRMTQDEPAPSRAFAGPTKMLVHPDDPRVILAATADLRTKVCQLIRSKNAGQTWEILDALPAPASYPFCTTHNPGVSQAVIAWGGDGTLYYALLGYGEGEGNRGQGVSVNVSVVLARSRDLGETWSTTLVMDNRGDPDANPSASAVTGLAVDTSRDKDVVYVGYSFSYPNVPNDSPLNDDPVVVSVSTDGGETFTEGTNLNGFSQVKQEIQGKEYPLMMTATFGRPFLVAHDGVVMAVSGPTTPFDQKPPQGGYFAFPYRYALPNLVARSTDQGRTWSMSKLGPPVFAGFGAQTGMGWTPKGGRDGTFIFSYAATPDTAESSGTADIVVQRSTDRGQTWSTPLAIDDDDPANRFSSFYPMLSVAPNGRVDVVWQDNRDMTGTFFNVRYTYSTDGGVTWAENVRVSDQPLNFDLGIGFNSDVRQPPGVASANEYAVFGWSDTRLGDELTQSQDNFGSIAQFQPIPKESSVLPIVAAAFGGLVLAGIVLLVVQLMRRDRKDRAGPGAERAPVGTAG